jgi:hypothetical protein
MVHSRSYIFAPFGRRGSLGLHSMSALPPKADIAERQVDVRAFECPNCTLLFVGDHLDQDARNADSSDPSSTENSTGIISFVVTLPFKSLSTTTSC